MTEEEKTKFYEELNSRLNRCIGRLTVPLMTLRDPDVKAVHTELLELAHWIDETLWE